MTLGVYKFRQYFHLFAQMHDLLGCNLHLLHNSIVADISVLFVTVLFDQHQDGDHQRFKGQKERQKTKFRGYR